MAKKKGHRVSRRRKTISTRPKTTVSPPPVTVVDEDLAVAQKITRYHSQIILMACVPQLFLILNGEWIRETTGNLTKWILLILFTLGFIGIYINYQYPITAANQGNPKRVRQRAVFLLALAIFINLINWIPIVYAYGHLDFLKQIRAILRIGNKLSLVIAFALGAIFSAVLGKLTFGVIKVIFRKIVLRNDRKPQESYSDQVNSNPQQNKFEKSQIENNKQGRRTSTYPTNARVIKPTPVYNDLVVARRISKINQIIVLVGVIPYSYPIVDLIGQRNLFKGNASLVLFVCVLVNCALMYVAVKLSRYSAGIFDESAPVIHGARKYRKLGKWQMTLGSVINLVALIPLLYAEGYLEKWTSLMPTAEFLGEKLSLAILFIVSAVATGVLGNLAYDVLRFVLKRR